MSKLSPRCPQCGATVPLDAPEGLCPACVLEQVMSAGPEGGQGTGPYCPGFKPPTPAELAEYFPQLEILELLGQGGMGIVYKARQPALDRLVALKILPPESGRDPAFAERFLREARALGRLAHPGIVAVYDFGQSDGLYYFVMEFVDGVNLRHLLREGELTPEEVLKIVPPICEALQYAHEEGIIHRDVKPENILLDRKGRVKIADFGLAKLLGQTPTDLALTGSRQVMGTPHYMAPEQAERPLAVDHRADIYSLGVVFYEMLTGELPLGRFAPPSQKVHVDVRLDEVVLRSLEKEPERRYQHASDVKTAVASITSGTPLRAVEKEPPQRHQQGREAVSHLASPEKELAPPRPERHDHATSARSGLETGLLLQRLDGLGFWLIVTGIVACVFWVLVWIAGTYRELWDVDSDGHLVFFMSKAGSMVSVVAFLGLLQGGVVILGGRKMKRLASYEFTVLSSILAMLPCSLGFLVGLPMGIWALLVLSKPEVRAVFQTKRVGKGTPEAKGASSPRPLHPIRRQ